MHSTRNDLDLEIRSKVCAILNARLAEAIDLSLQAKQAHWNVKGASFIALHEFFDKLTDEVREYVDEIAERVTALGGTAEGTMKMVATRSKLPAYPADVGDSRAHLEALVHGFAAFGKAVRANIDEVAKLGDAGSSDLLTGVSRGIDKSLWMLESHL